MFASKLSSSSSFISHLSSFLITPHNLFYNNNISRSCQQQSSLVNLFLISWRCPFYRDVSTLSTLLNSISLLLSLLFIFNSTNVVYQFSSFGFHKLAFPNGWESIFFGRFQRHTPDRFLIIDNLFSSGKHGMLTHLFVNLITELVPVDDTLLWDRKQPSSFNSSVGLVFSNYLYCYIPIQKIWRIALNYF